MASHLAKLLAWLSLGLLFLLNIIIPENKELQRIAHEHTKRVLDEQKMLNIELENKQKGRLIPGTKN